MWATYEQNASTVAWLLHMGVDPNVQTTDTKKGIPKGTTPLMLAARQNDSETATLLLMKGAKADLKDATGKTAESHARAADSAEVLRAMGFKVFSCRRLDDLIAGVAAGADANALDGEGWTPLMWAAYYQDKDACSVLLAKGADPNIRSGRRLGKLEKGSTALMVASYGSSAELVDLLLRYKADPSIGNANNLTPAMLATNYGYTQIANMLQPGDGCQPLGKTYRKILLTDFTSLPVFGERLKDVVQDCQAYTFETIQANARLQAVEMVPTGGLHEEGTLLLRVHITELHIPAGATRFFLSVLAGKSRIKARLQLVDGVSGKLLRESEVGTENSALISSISLSAHDMSIPEDLALQIQGWLERVNQ